MFGAVLFASLVMSSEALSSVATRTTKPGLHVTWEPSAASRILTLADEKESSAPLLVGVVGIPGSGKSTGAEILQDLLGSSSCLCIPMDGYHYSMEHLMNQKERATDLIYRRGAPDTFDAAALQRDLELVRSGLDPSICFPGFDHAVGDPEPNQYQFCRDTHKIVITEGLYLLHDDDGWEGIQQKFDMTIFVDADLETCMARLKIRNRKIPGYTIPEIEARVDEVDRCNALTVQRSRERADLVVEAPRF